MGPLFFGQTSFVEIQRKMYEEWKKEPYFGFRGFSRGVVLNNNDPLSQNLFNVDGHKWKSLRGKLTPAFTTGKIKQMFTLMGECVKNFERYLLNQVGEGKVFECRSLAAKYSLSCICSFAFGIHLITFDQENNEFQVIARYLFIPSFYNLIKQMASVAAPKLYKFLGLTIMPKKYSNFFINFIKETVERRKREKVVRNDVIDLLIDMDKNRQDFDFDSTDSLLASQAFVFFVAGFEAISATISFALYEMAIVPEIQEKIRSEILETLKKHNGQLSYDIINEMKYLIMVIYETLRKNPPGLVLLRKSVKPFKLPGSKGILPTGSLVFISPYCLHYDEQYYPNSEIFDPERFKDDRKQSVFFIFW
ncbi:hypothetical protein KQX54_018243 [Cotesia glomerata]|uniref:Cytochrome P450 n=1 Tax=Cotesia glomerata TaxID=32391 RepID=A0AAV7I068_COTGL|nr:hypothetical protein KQX54_018243 [Cotesia glomerata]